ncbi:MAG: InlB B-repeat-containing protein, partial [Nitrososphaeria archaeon]
TITATQSGSVTGSYQLQFYLTMSANPSGEGSVSPNSGWYDAGASVQISATANTGYAFSSWTGSGSGSYSGTSNPATVTMDSAITETANFLPVYTVVFSTNGLGSIAQGTVLTVNGTSYTYSQLPVTYSVASGQTLTYSWSSPVPGGSGIQFVWASGSGLDSAQSGSFVATQSGNVIATYQTQYYLTMQVNPSGSGTVSPAS